MNHSSGSLRPLLAICAVGVALRLLLLLAAGSAELQADESNYVYLAMKWRRFGFYFDSNRFIWPPGYTWILARMLDLLGMAGLFAMKLLQVLGSASIGLSIMLLARRMGGQRAALFAGAAWCVYLPMGAFTHYLWNESLFLALFTPAMLLAWGAIEDGERTRDRSIVLCGLCFSACAYIKESPTYLGLVLVALFATLGAVPLRERLRRASLFTLTCAVAVLPWTLHNLEVYGRFVPIGSSLGENAFGGLNAPYKNFDLTAYGRDIDIEANPLKATRSWFVEIDPSRAWLRAEEIKNTPDRLDENARRGLEFASENPGWFLRSRIMKLADLVTPLSFFVRHQVLGHYEEFGPSFLGRSGVREGLIIWAVLCPLLLLPLGLAGLCSSLRESPARWLALVWLGYFVATGMLVAMSRFRLPLVPLLIAAAGAFLAGGWRGLGRPRALVPAAAGLILLLFLWWINLPEFSAVMRLAL